MMWWWRDLIFPPSWQDQWSAKTVLLTLFIHLKQNKPNKKNFKKRKVHLPLNWCYTVISSCLIFIQFRQISIHLRTAGTGAVTFPSAFIKITPPAEWKLQMVLWQGETQWNHLSFFWFSHGAGWEELWWIFAIPKQQFHCSHSLCRPAGPGSFPDALSATVLAPSSVLLSPVTASCPKAGCVEGEMCPGGSTRQRSTGVTVPFNSLLLHWVFPLILIKLSWPHPG